MTEAPLKLEVGHIYIVENEKCFYEFIYLGNDEYDEFYRFLQPASNEVCHVLESKKQYEILTDTELKALFAGKTHA